MRVCDKRDINWITALMLEPDVFRNCQEDGVTRRNTKNYVKNLLTNPGITVIAPVPGKFIHTFSRHNQVMYEVHTAISKRCDLTGPEKVALTRKASSYMILAGARKIITQVPEDNRAGKIYARMCGMDRVGVLTKSLKRDGQLLDMVLYQSRDDEVKAILDKNTGG